MKTRKEITETKIRRWIIFFMVALAVSGITAFPLETELQFLVGIADHLPWPVSGFITRVYEAVKNTNEQYPFMAYGTDWLAFAHIVIAAAFIGPYRDPVKNSWIIEWGMISCLMVFPLALCCGFIRGIPVYWQLIDCSFGMFGLVPLLRTHSLIRQLEKMSSNTN